MDGRPYRQPAEWAPQRACWTAYPHDADLWGDGLEAAQAEVLALCRILGATQEVVLCAPQPLLPFLGQSLAGTQARAVALDFGDIWLRDTAPIFVHDRAGAVHAACFDFNGWGGKYRLAGDDGVRRAVARAAGTPAFGAEGVLEGGAIDTDGEGTFLTTRQCLLNPNRGGPGSPAAAAARLAPWLGVERLLWADQGLIGDHTDGHVDTLARFVAPGEVACMAPAGGDPNAQALAAVQAAFAGAEDARGRRLRVHAVPSPGAVRAADGALMPASYLNFVIGWRTVVVPTYGVAADAAAVAAIAALFAGRRAVVGSPARAILAGGGALHCITQQQPHPLSTPNAGSAGR